MQRLVKLVRAVSPPLECGAVRLTWHKTPSQVGSSKRLYASFVSLCRQHYGQEGLVAACSLRSQVLLALHETKPGQPGGAPSDVSTFDRCFELARDLDACVKARARAISLRVWQSEAHAPPCREQDGYADEERLKAISAHVEKLERDVESASASRKSVPKFRLVAQGMQSENSDGGASVSRPEDTPATWLADAGLILRDPPVLHLLLHETARPLVRAAAAHAPSADPLAAGAHAAKRGRARGRPQGGCAAAAAHKGTSALASCFTAPLTPLPW